LILPPGLELLSCNKSVIFLFGTSVDPGILFFVTRGSNTAAAAAAVTSLVENCYLWTGVTPAGTVRLIKSTFAKGNWPLVTTARETLLVVASHVYLKQVERR